MHPVAHYFGAGDVRRTCLKKLGSGVVLLWASAALQCQAAPAFTLKELTDAALTHNPAMRVTQAQEDAAQAAVTSATALINPEVEAGVGPSRYRSGSNETKNNWGVALSQPIEFGSVREARRAYAESGVRMASGVSELTRTELQNRVRLAFYDVLQRQSVLALIGQDKALLTQIRDKVKLRVDLGESPRYELIKAETEVLAAERDYRAALVRVEEGKTLLRGMVGAVIPTQFELRGEYPRFEQPLDLTSLQEKLAESPLMRQARMLNDSAEARLRLEERLRQPGLTVKAGIEQDPDLTSFRVGLAIPLPLWNQRQGPIAEAAAGVRQAQAHIGERELALRRELESTYQRYQIAREQVATFESGLLAQAEAVLKVAESAYRYGERGILDYLDAQRTYRAVRKDHLAARHDLVNTILEIERLLGSELLEDKS